jgi:hypothetical protein
MKNYSKNFIALLLGIGISLITIISCDPEKNGDLIGPCVHIINEPILHITSIRDTIINKAIPFIEITDLKINGYHQTGISPIIESYSIVANDSIYYCNVPFGFGVEEGIYEFTIKADGYPPKQILIEDVNYSIFEGGCPSFNDGGKRVELVIN